MEEESDVNPIQQSLTPFNISLERRILMVGVGKNEASLEPLACHEFLIHSLQWKMDR